MFFLNWLQKRKEEKARELENKKILEASLKTLRNVFGEIGETRAEIADSDWDMSKGKFLGYDLEFFSNDVFFVGFLNRGEDLSSYNFLGLRWAVKTFKAGGFDDYLYKQIEAHSPRKENVPRMIENILYTLKISEYIVNKYDKVDDYEKVGPLRRNYGIYMCEKEDKNKKSND